MSARRDSLPKELSLPSPAAVKLACGHIQKFYPPPRPHDTVFCFRCDAYSSVSTITGWRTICQAAKCPMSREYGLSESKCAAMALRHAKNYDHLVGVHWSGTLAYVIGPYGRVVTKP